MTSPLYDHTGVRLRWRHHCTITQAYVYDDDIIVRSHRRKFTMTTPLDDHTGVRLRWRHHCTITQAYVYDDDTIVRSHMRKFAMMAPLYEHANLRFSWLYYNFVAYESFHEGLFINYVTNFQYYIKICHCRTLNTPTPKLNPPPVPLPLFLNDFYWNDAP